MSLIQFSPNGGLAQLDFKKSQNILRNGLFHGSHNQGTFISRTKLTFPGQSIQDLKVINQDTCGKTYHVINSSHLCGTASLSPPQAV